jgi:hypothetical protein
VPRKEEEEEEEEKWEQNCNPEHSTNKILRGGENHARSPKIHRANEFEIYSVKFCLPTM